MPISGVRGHPEGRNVLDQVMTGKDGHWILPDPQGRNVLVWGGVDISVHVYIYLRAPLICIRTYRPVYSCTVATEHRTQIPRYGIAITQRVIAHLHDTHVHVVHTYTYANILPPIYTTSTQLLIHRQPVHCALPDGSTITP